MPTCCQWERSGLECVGLAVSALLVISRCWCYTWYLSQFCVDSSTHLCRYRLVNTRSRFVLLHSNVLFEPASLHLWNKFINVIFIRYWPDSSKYEITTVKFPNPMQDNFTLDFVTYWRPGYFLVCWNFFMYNFSTSLKLAHIHILFWTT